jgi:hypothetical protein
MKETNKLIEQLPTDFVFYLLNWRNRGKFIKKKEVKPLVQTQKRESRDEYKKQSKTRRISKSFKN